jgi:hypothetical protein
MAAGDWFGVLSVVRWENRHSTRGTHARFRPLQTSGFLRDATVQYGQIVFCEWRGEVKIVGITELKSGREWLREKQKVDTS